MTTDVKVPAANKFCVGFEKLSPWRQLDDYCRLLARDMSGILWEDFRRAVEEDQDQALMEKFYRVFEAKREVEEFYGKLIDEFMMDDEKSLRIIAAWSRFEKRWEDFVKEWSIDEKVMDNVKTLGKQLLA
jgi:hypothetical protein